MRRTILSVLIIISFIPGSLAQQLPQYTQYTFNELLINPAVTGIESYWDVKAGHRSQWSGLQGAPTTSYLTLSIPLGRNFTMDDYAQMIRNSENPIGKLNVDSYRASASHSGISLSLISDKAGAFSQTHINMGYAYHIQVSGRFNLATGATFGFNRATLNTGGLTFGDQTDPLTGQNTQSLLKPDAALGLWAYGASYFFGVSAQQLLPQALTYSTDSKANTQYFFTAGIKLYPSNDVTLLPSVVFNPSNLGPANLDLNLKAAFRDVFWIGGAYRKDDAVSGSFGFNIGALFTLGYSYDHSLSGFNNGTHEIMLGMFLNNNYNTTSPRHTW